MFEKYCWMMVGLSTCDQIKSADGNRFPEGIGVFLQKLSAMIAIAVENSLNQQRINEISYQDVFTQAYNRR